MRPALELAEKANTKGMNGNAYAKADATPPHARILDRAITESDAVVEAEPVAEAERFDPQRPGRRAKEAGRPDAASGKPDGKPAN